jgi:hypothetical protein
MPFSHGTALLVILSDEVSILQMYAIRLFFCGNPEVN